VFSAPKPAHRAPPAHNGAEFIFNMRMRHYYRVCFDVDCVKNLKEMGYAKWSEYEKK